jgi:hypothetical protein
MTASSALQYTRNAAPAKESALCDSLFFNWFA